MTEIVDELPGKLDKQAVYDSLPKAQDFANQLIACCEGNVRFPGSTIVEEPGQEAKKY